MEIAKTPRPVKWLCIIADVAHASFIDAELLRAQPNRAHDIPLSRTATIKFSKIESSTYSKTSRECRAWLIFSDSSNTAEESKMSPHSWWRKGRPESFYVIDRRFLRWWVVTGREKHRSVSRPMEFTTFRYHSTDPVIAISNKMPYHVRSWYNLKASPWRSSIGFLLGVQTHM